jgi:LmbE family N-acetylglucosaminyl deacetylase
LLFSFGLSSPAQAQLEPPSTGGLVALTHELRMIGHYKRVLMIGAHPDDEDTELLTILVRDLGAEAAYLSLNRGEGGQNLIGPELGEELGIIRTEELLAARRLDGARQFFTRAYDFGFSKTLEETWQHWPRDSILKDVVRVVRRFRPQIIVSIFSGTPIDGHGQHQAAGWAAKEAFRIAGDPDVFPELLKEENLRPWAPFKLYRSTRFDTAATTLVLDGGVLDEAVGQSYHQIAMRARSLHRSQDMGRLQTLGPSAVRVALWEDRTGGGTRSFFAGIDTSIAALPWDRDATVAQRLALARVFQQLDSLRSAPERLDSLRSTRERPDSLQYASELRLTRAKTRASLDSALAVVENASGTQTTPEQIDQLAHVRLARRILRGEILDATASDGRVIPGQAVAVTARLWNGGSTRLAATAILRADSTPINRGQKNQASQRLAAAAGALDSAVFTWTVPDHALPSRPYFLVLPRSGDLYTWPPEQRRWWGDPFEEAVPGMAFLEEGHPAGFLDVTYRTNDQARGEVRRPVFVVPRVAVSIEPQMLVWPTASRPARTFTVTLTHGARDPTEGTLHLVLPPGWPKVDPRPFRFTKEDEEQPFEFTVRPPAALQPGLLSVRAIADEGGGKVDTLGVELIDYPHIRPHQLVRPASATIRATALVLPRLARVGYVRGAADRVPEALAEVGVPIVLLDKPTLERGDLSRFDAIVVGSRAYETDTALVAGNDRLLAYARAGGLVIVQYQQFQFSDGKFAPYPLTIGFERGMFRTHDRVTDENAVVTVLDTTSPALLHPNRIDSEDWGGWVQERGLYFAHTWDQRYQPLLAMHDPGEEPLRGSLLIARVGKGRWVYTGLSFFRQLPAGVPGAFRLFANLLALGTAPTR